jgi:hypothetical protein
MLQEILMLIGLLKSYKGETMIQVTYTKQDSSKVSVSPMPSGVAQLFGDATIPNSPAQDCCLVRTSQSLRSQGINVSVPKLTEDELTQAVTDQLADKANWDETVEVSEQEVSDRKDSIRGYTDKEMEDYISENTTYKLDNDDEYILDKDGEKIVDEQPTQQEAIAKLITKEMDMVTMQQTPVTVPNDSSIEATITAEKETVIAESKVSQLVSSGHLVTDLTALDEDSNEIYADWKAQFEVTVIAE